MNGVATTCCGLALSGCEDILPPCIHIAAVSRQARRGFHENSFEEHIRTRVNSDSSLIILYNVRDASPRGATIPHDPVVHVRLGNVANLHQGVCQARSCTQLDASLALLGTANSGQGGS